MAFVIGVGLDRDARPNEFSQHAAQAGQPFAGNLVELGAMLLHHPLVVLGGDGRQPLRDEVVVGEAPLHLDHFALLAEVFDVMH